MIFHLLIVFLFTFNMIHSESHDKKDEKDKMIEKMIDEMIDKIIDKICIDKPDKNLADKIAVCENSFKTTVNMNIEFKIDQFHLFYFYFY